MPSDPLPLSPETRAGKALLAWLQDQRSGVVSATSYSIIAIEQEARTLARAEVIAELETLGREVEAADEPAYRHIMHGSFVKESILVGTVLPEWLRLRLLAALSRLGERE